MLSGDLFKIKPQIKDKKEPPSMRSKCCKLHANWFHFYRSRSFVWKNYDSLPIQASIHCKTRQRIIRLGSTHNHELANAAAKEKRVVNQAKPCVFIFFASKVQTHKTIKSDDY